MSRVLTSNRDEGWDSERASQESPVLSRCLIVGGPDYRNYGGGKWPGAARCVINISSPIHGITYLMSAIYGIALGIARYHKIHTTGW